MYVILLEQEGLSEMCPQIRSLILISSYLGIYTFDFTAKASFQGWHDTLRILEIHFYFRDFSSESYILQKL